VLQEKSEDWDSVIETQLNAVFLLSKLAAKSMLSRKKLQEQRVLGLAGFGLRYRNDDSCRRGLCDSMMDQM
jgi:NAD(P)-dependent dehydrogenase (short-subunit alcohol dehydrogenase family)